MKWRLKVCLFSGIIEQFTSGTPEVESSRGASPTSPEEGWPTTGRGTMVQTCAPPVPPNSQSTNAGIIVETVDIFTAPSKSLSLSLLGDWKEKDLH